MEQGVALADKDDFVYHSLCIGKRIISVRSKEWWQPRRDSNRVAEAWLTEGYTLDYLDLKKKKVAFKRVNEGYARLQIPEVFLEDKLPNNAIVELENFFAYIKKRYWL